MRLVFALIVALIPIVAGAGQTNSQEVLEMMKNREPNLGVRLPEQGRKPLHIMQRIDSGNEPARRKTAAETLLASAPSSPRSPRSTGSPGRSNSGRSGGSPGSAPSSPRSPRSTGLPGRSNSGRGGGSPGSGPSHGSSLPRTPPAGKQSRAVRVRGAVSKGLSKVGGCITACILGPGSMAGRKRG